MRYIIRQKIFSLGDSFTIKDEFGNDVFIVRSQIFSFGKKLRIFDLSGNELCYIEQKLFRFMPEYDIYIAGELVANVRKKFALFRNDFEITTPGDQYYVDGDFFAHEFGIYRHGKLIARISKKFFAFSDTYGVDIDDGQDQISTLALAIVIDMVCHDHDD
ncbi:LURP-one-related family protein [Pseudoclostridium thermosuccinogenes]|jgi:uncharacterized protein YxjI|uniref:LURP-one-related/scramblase family protein n=1 Tax=Clostridium thermosuccinogenes TaxID=84032 RepID=UPI000CCBDDED|nr:LURP-one-related family protein [Pseudoclostridium thermosuccinogenes]PNT91139.1 hypothetical protein CDQ83_15100 [Pseudoclostridium thermosuccinogenes]